MRDAACRGGRDLLAAPLVRSPYVAIEGSWADYERQLSRSRRKALRRNHRRLEREGRVDVEIVDGSESLELRLAEAYAIESSGWKGDNGTAIVSHPSTRRFYGDVARWGAERDFLRLAFLRLDGCAIAFDYALQHEGVWYSLKAGYDDGFRPFGPGALLLREELAQAFSAGLTRFDLLGDEDAFKLSWTYSSTQRMRLRAFTSTMSGRLARALVQADDRLRPAMRAMRTRVAR
jgi:CelD/BcsL family acetyltransferase involved in cellulose biosynthesis